VKQSGVEGAADMASCFWSILRMTGYWSSRGVEHHLDKVAVPTLSVGGYYDQEDMWGPQEEYASLEPHDAKHENFLVLGPWRHGSWASSSRHLGALQYGESIGKEFRSQIEGKVFCASI
jgi:predicted acyl esterase